jgi:hypothetical protein
MDEYLQFVYLAIALERFELKKIGYEGYEKPEKRKALSKSEVGILSALVLGIHDSGFASLLRPSLGTFTFQ